MTFPERLLKALNFKQFFLVLQSVHTYSMTYSYIYHIIYRRYGHESVYMTYKFSAYVTAQEMQMCERRGLFTASVTVSPYNQFTSNHPPVMMGECVQ